MKKRASQKTQSLYQQITPTELRKGDLRKLEILQATLTCLAAHGWAGTNYESVGQICGMKRPHVAYHYPEWNTLIESAIRFAYATGASVVGDYLREAKTREQLLSGYVEGTLHWLDRNPDHAAAISLLWHLATFDPRYHALAMEYRELGTSRVHAILTDGKTIDHKNPVWKRARAIHSLIVGHCIEYMSSGGADRKSVAAIAVAAAKELLP